MKKTNKTKKRNRFTLHMKKKLLFIFGGISFLLILLIVRLTYINVVKGESYTKQVLSQQSYDSQTIPYRRGDIVDCNGTVLATSTEVYNLIFDCKVLNLNEDCIEPTISALVECFPELSSDDLHQLLTDTPDSQYKVLLKQLPYEDIQAFMELMNDTENNPDIDGVWFESEYVRSYPYSSLASNLIGFTSSDGTGMNGIESSYNDELSGVNGRKYGYLNSDSNLETTTIAAEDGDTVQSTIDVNIQSIVEDAIENFNEEYENAYRTGEAGSKNTAVIVMDPNSGEILAMAQYPDYDLNNPRDLTAYYTQDEIDAMTEDEQYDALDNLWTNYTISHTFEPGSTAKPFTVAAGLETGVLTGNETFVCDGSEQVGGHTIGCSHTHGTITLGQSLSLSCNDALMQIAAMEGSEIFCEYQQIFNFGLKTNIDLPGEARTDSLIYTTDTMNSTSLATNAFGQNFNATMIQVASAFCSVINGGNYYQPHVVSKLLDSDGNTVETISPTILKQTISQETSDTIRNYLIDTVTSGTGTAAAVEGYSIGGKTGTAEKLPRDKESYIVSFIGFAPADNPQVVVYVVIDEPNAENQAQSGLAAALSQTIFSQILPYMNIFPDGEETTTLSTEYTNEYSDSDSVMSDENDGDVPADSTDTATEDSETETTQQ